MILDIIIIVILILSALLGRRTGLFKIIARLTSFILAGVCTALFGESIRGFFTETPLYGNLYEKLTGAVSGAIETGETALIAPFIREGATNQIVELTSKGIADSILSVLIFGLFFLVVRLCIGILDKTVFHLPLVRPANRLTGMLASLAITVIVLYLVVGILGGMAAYAENTFFAQQMQSSKIVRFMYENNFVLDTIIGKG